MAECAPFNWQLAALDGTGWESRHVSRYFVRRRGKGPKKRVDTTFRRFPMAGVLCDCRSHLTLSIVPDRGPGADIRHFRRAGRRPRPSTDRHLVGRRRVRRRTRAQVRPRRSRRQHVHPGQDRQEEPQEAERLLASAHGELPHAFALSAAVAGRNRQQHDQTIPRLRPPGPKRALPKSRTSPPSADAQRHDHQTKEVFDRAPNVASETPRCEPTAAAVENRPYA